ncbi:hcngp-like protein [Ophiostoma piceae UAMH 11346]|uniref:Hcngp-like protein n=1 Tax=Ophiostoma piceae (strain UAMH 11346) TaxID=1262450 RepID=S3BZK2_OPHP1|nr:hcngp-like protein [Ophiostoma piceae UAMH 11346]
MAGLVGYASSDEESDRDEIQQSPAATNGAQDEVAEPQLKPSQLSEAPRIEEAELAAQQKQETSSTHQAEQAPAPALAPALGPAPGPPVEDVVIGPSRPAAADMAALPSLDDDEDSTMVDAANGIDEGIDRDSDKGGELPLSPYSAERAAVRQLTMPRVPDFDIPADEDDDQDHGDTSSTALNKKFATFLDLKQKKDTHFNARLAQSDAMKNPALMDKLMAFVGLPGGSTDEDAKAAVDPSKAAAPYGTTLPAEIWDPAAFPAEAYRRSLRRLQEEAAKQRARVPGEPVSFVSATSAESTPAAGKRKSRFD